MQDAIQRLQATTFSWPGRPAKALREHRAILRAIGQRDPAAAEEAARVHMREALRYRMLLLHKRD
jgi:DNA-binding FadR family transcriptional regulator